MFKKFFPANHNIRLFGNVEDTMKLRHKIILFQFGGAVYYLIEVLWKGSSHWSMFLAGGVCFRLIGIIRNKLSSKSIWIQCLAGSGIITAIEFITGCIVNKILHLNVWDYSALPFQILGQICLPFSILWYGLSWIALHVDNWFCRLMLQSPTTNNKPSLS